MNNIQPQRPRIRLPREDYHQLHRQVLKRDGWRCQACGAMTNLEVHHRQFRSRSGDDDETNLMALCVDCHRRVHEIH